MVSLTHQPFVEFGMYGRRKLPRSFFFVSRVSKITPSPIPINKGDLQGDLRMVYSLFTKWEFPDIRLNGSEKPSSPIWKFTGVWGGVLENDLQFVYKWSWCKTFIPSPISIKIAFCTPYFEKYSPIVYSPPHLIATENAKPHPLLKKYLSPICTNKRF